MPTKKTNTRFTKQKKELCKKHASELLESMLAPQENLSDLKHRIHLVEINLAIIGENHPQIKGIKTLIQELASIFQQLEKIETTPVQNTEVIRKLLALLD